MHLDNHSLNQLQNHSLKTWIERKLRNNGNQLQQNDIQQLNNFLDEWRGKFLQVNNQSLAKDALINQLREEKRQLRGRKEHWKNEVTIIEREFEARSIGFYSSDAARNAGENVLNSFANQMEVLKNRVFYLEGQRLNLRNKLHTQEILSNNQFLSLQRDVKNQAKIIQELESQISIIQQIAEVEITESENEKNSFRNKFGKTSKIYKKTRKKVKQLTNEVKQLNHNLQKEKSFRKSEQKKLTVKQNQLDKSKDKVRTINRIFLRLLKELQKEKQDHQQTKLAKGNYYSQLNQTKTENNSLKNELAEKSQIIRVQAQRIRELENKPPVVETKPQAKEVIQEIEKPVEKLVAVESEEQKREIVRLQRIIKELERKLTEKITYQPNNQNLPKTKIYAERVVIYSLLVIICLLLVKNLTRKRKVKKKFS